MPPGPAAGSTVTGACRASGWGAGIRALRHSPPSPALRVTPLAPQAVWDCRAADPLHSPCGFHHIRPSYGSIPCSGCPTQLVPASPSCCIAITASEMRMPGQHQRQEQRRNLHAKSAAASRDPPAGASGASAPRPVKSQETSTTALHPMTPRAGSRLPQPSLRPAPSGPRTGATGPCARPTTAPLPRYTP